MAHLFTKPKGMGIKGMRGVDDETVEKCATIADAMMRELEATKPKARKGPYDRRTAREIDYAIRAVRRVGDRIRALKGIMPEGPAPAANPDRLKLALAVAKDMRPLIVGMAQSQFKQDMLRRLDELGA